MASAYLRCCCRTAYERWGPPAVGLKGLARTVSGGEFCGGGDSRVNIFIPTCGRATRQVTWAGLPLALQRRTTLVVQHKERGLYDAYPNVKILPPEIHTIAATRQYIVFNLFPRVATSEKLIMLDDDLTFLVRRKDDPTKFLGASNAHKVALFNTIEEELSRYTHVGVIGREGGNRATSGNLECTRMMRVLAYYQPTLVKHKCSFLRGGPNFTMEDFDMLLQLLRLGHKNLVLTAWGQGQGSSNATGGCATYRTLELHNINARKLAALHPEFVKCVEKTTKTAWGGATRTDVTVQWKKAYESSRAV